MRAATQIFLYMAVANRGTIVPASFSLVHAHSMKGSSEDICSSTAIHLAAVLSVEVPLLI